MRTNLQNLTPAIPQLSPVCYFLVPFFFLNSGWFLKSTKNIFRILCFSGNQKHTLKRHSHQIFDIRFFAHESTRFQAMVKNMPKIAELKLPSCRLEVADFRYNCDCGIAELRLWSNIFFKVAELWLWTKKKLRVPSSEEYVCEWKWVWLRNRFKVYYCASPIT